MGTRSEMRDMRTSEFPRAARLFAFLMLLLLVAAACASEPETPEAAPQADDAAVADPPDDDAAVDATDEDDDEDVGPVEPQTRTRLVIGFAGRVVDEAHAFYTSVPETMGWFAEEGISVDILNAAGGTEAVQAVIGEDANVAVTGPSTAFASREAGEPMTFVATTVQQLHLYPAVLDDSPIESVEDFAGATIGIPSLGTSLLPPLRGQIREAGLDPDSDVEFIPIGGSPQILQAYLNGEIDVMGLFDIAYALMRVQGHNVRTFDDDPFLETLAIGQGVMAMDPWLEQNEETIVGFLRAMVKGEVFAKENPECAAEMHWSLWPESLAVGVDEDEAREQGIAKVQQRSTGQFPVDGKWAMVDGDVMANWGEFLLFTGDIETEVDPDPVWTNRYIEQANEDVDHDEIAELARNTTC